MEIDGTTCYCSYFGKLPMGEEGDETDFLLELLSYECPFTGKKRTAGMIEEPEPCRLFLGKKHVLIFVCFQF